jgi:hypothetical protein
MSALGRAAPRENVLPDDFGNLDDSLRNSRNDVQFLAVFGFVCRERNNDP